MFQSSWLCALTSHLIRFDIFFFYLYLQSGDGKHNGLELGDPCCTWTEGGNPDVASGLSHPGRDDSTTTNTIPETCKDVCEGKSDSKSGGVDSGATKYAPSLVVGCALVAINFLN